MIIPGNLVKILKLASDSLKGVAKRQFIAKTTQELGIGSQRACERQLNWCRTTIRKGVHELNTNVTCIDNVSSRGRKKLEELNPQLVEHVKEIVENSGALQADPDMNSERLYLKITSNAVRKQLKNQFNYPDTKIPSERSMTNFLNKNNYYLKKVRKTIPKKKIPETDAIFSHLSLVNKQADESPVQVRISFDAKATVKIGNLSRGGKNRVETHADDHDFTSTGTITPVGIYKPKEKDLSLYMVESKVTSDCCVDIIERWWLDEMKNNPTLKRLVINLDNGPAQNSKSGQFMKRIQAFSNKYNIETHLAYYPPYHSKYNPVERTFGALEKYWSGEILDSKEKVVGLAKTMTWANKLPIVQVVKKTYEKGVKVSKDILEKLNCGFERKVGIEKWYVLITPTPEVGMF